MSARQTEHHRRPAGCLPSCLLSSMTGKTGWLGRLQVTLRRAAYLNRVQAAANSEILQDSSPNRNRQGSCCDMCRCSSRCAYLVVYGRAYVASGNVCSVCLLRLETQVERSSMYKVECRTGETAAEKPKGQESTFFLLRLRDALAKG